MQYVNLTYAIIRRSMDNTTYNHNIRVPNHCHVKIGVYPVKNLTKTPHVRTINTGILQIITDPNLIYTDTKVLLFMISYMEFENIFLMSQTQIGQELGITRQSVTKSLKTLLACGYVRVLGQIGKVNIYGINPRIAFKSRSIKYEKMCKTWDEETEAESKAQQAS